MRTGTVFNGVVDDDVKCRLDASLMALVYAILLEGAVLVQRARKIPKGAQKLAPSTNSMYRMTASVQSTTGEGLARIQ